MARTPISIEMKLEVLEALATKSKADVAREFGIGYSTVKKIKKNEEEIKKMAGSRDNLLRKRCRQSPNEEVGNAVITWYKQMKAQNMPMTGPIMLEKAKEFAAVFGFEDFKPSHGWLERLKARHNIRFKPPQSRPENNEAGEWTEDILPKMVEGYDPNNIFNADETALYYKVAPSILTGNHPQTGATSKDRLTVLLICNSTGTEKKAFTVGKVSNPPCFEKEGTPLPYYSSENGLMTNWIWCDILQKLDRSLNKRKIVLLVDREGCHTTKMELKNIKIVFIPLNSPNNIQPLHQGIIQMLKMYYRAKLVKRMISVLNEGVSATDFTKTIDVLQALRILQSAWFAVSSAVIIESFQKAGFYCDDVYYINDEPDCYSEISELKNIVQEEFETFVECDKDVECFENMLNSSSVQPKPESVSAQKNGNVKNNEPRVSHKQALKALSVIRRYLDENFSEYDAYYEVEEMVRLSALANGSENEME